MIPFRYWRHYVLAYLSGIRSCRTAAWAPKVNYLTQTTAERVAKNMSIRTGQTLEAYPCPHCKGWHIGHVMSLSTILRSIWTRITERNLWK